MRYRNKLVFLLVVLSIFLVSCSKPAEKTHILPNEGKPIVTATTTFVSDMVERLAGDAVQLVLIIPAGRIRICMSPNLRFNKTNRSGFGHLSRSAL